MIKKIFNNLPINMKLTLTCIIGLLIIGLIYYPLIPNLLNYPPDSINNDFQLKVNPCHYTIQYLFIVCLVIIIFLIILPFIFRKINKIEHIKKSDIKDDPSLLSAIKTCFNFPFVMLLVLLLFPPILIFIGLMFLTNEFEFSLKTTFILFSMISLLALLIYSFSCFLFESILKKVKITDTTYGIRLNLKNKILLQLLPLLLFTLVFSFLILYSQLSSIKGDSLYDYYRQTLIANLEDKEFNSIEEAKTFITEEINFRSSDDSIFILDDNGNVYYSEYTLSDFFKTYIYDFEEKHNGHTYEYYGTPVQGSFIRKNIDGKDWIIGVRYSVFTNDTIFSIIPLFGIITLVNLFFIIIMASNYGNKLKVIIKNLSNISKDSADYINSKLPVYSNDEIGDLTIAFNNIQDLTKSYIKQLHDNQDTLMESERLASLGQLIGGIAHNLKTPIMSISGATEGLKDLIDEYDSSIDDPQVNSKDHHEIAKDMYSWISKIKTHTEYMSDIITAVKGQAVTLSTENEVYFSVDELLKRVNILMKHELKNAIIYLNTKVLTDENTIIKGDVNSLVQVINNMISNSIQAYNGKPNQNIDLIVEKEENNLIISIKDYASGIPKKVKEKLFKEMITTKGKNGTGLGLYMSYSTIKAHFNGDIKVESTENVGTTFSIILPLS